MDSAKTELADKLKAANNILVTVSRDPSVDQLAACIGLTLLLNKLGKHAAAVFSGQVPSTIEFLKPEETIEKNTDSLRDFIIALDKSKADKLRYKVEDNVVRIFITPYRTSISEADLDFSQGDFNVDVVVALGVQQQEDLDEAITAHGRILHDATVTSITTSSEQGLGSINWQVPQASSLSELVTDLTQNVGDNLLDGQIATALLTGIVAETDRFSNDKTSSQTMSASAVLMAAGANQQLVASKLEAPEPPPEKGDAGQPATPTGGPDTNGGRSAKPDDGTLEIDHESAGADQPADHADDNLPELQLPDLGQVDVITGLPGDKPEPAKDGLSPGSRLMTEAPTMGGMLTANTEPEGEGQVSDPLSQVVHPNGPILSHKDGLDEAAPPADAGKPEIGEVKATGDFAEAGLMSAEPAQTDTKAVTIEPLKPAAPPPDITAVPAEPQPAVPGPSQPPKPPQPAFAPEPPELQPVFTPAPPSPAEPQPFVPEPQQPAFAPEPQPVAAPEPPQAPKQVPSPITPGGFTPPPPAWVPPDSDPLHLGSSEHQQTLSDIEASVDSPHLEPPNAAAAGAALDEGLAAARDEVTKALSGSQQAPEPIQALNAQPLGELLHPAEPAPPADPDMLPGFTSDPGAHLEPETPVSSPSSPAGTPQVSDPTAPPPVPPPIPFQFRPPGQ